MSGCSTFQTHLSYFSLPLLQKLHVVFPVVEDQAQTLEPVLKRQDCRNTFLQAVNVLIYEKCYSVSLGWSLQFKGGSNSAWMLQYDLPPSLSFFFLWKLFNGITFCFTISSELSASGHGSALGFCFYADLLNQVSLFLLQLVWNNRGWTALFIASRHQLICPLLTFKN